MDLKTLILEYIGDKYEPENGEVTVEMAKDTINKEFPELISSLSANAFLEGYSQGLEDVEFGINAAAKEGFEGAQKRSEIFNRLRQCLVKN